MFLTPDYSDPKRVVDFLEIADREERAIHQRGAYELITALLETLPI
jgi:hypothetical protein